MSRAFLKKLSAKKLAAFTLAEIMLVLAIIGILVMLALPKLLPMIASAKSKEAQIQLNHLMQCEKMYFYTNSKYSSNLGEVGFEPVTLVSEGGKANYKIEIVEASNKGFLARATSITDFDADGTFNVWEIDQKETLKEVTAD